MMMKTMPPSDTTPAAASIQLMLYRRLGTAGRARLAAELSDAVRETSLAGIRRRHPEYTEAEVRRSFLELVYGIRIECHER